MHTHRAARRATLLMVVGLSLTTVAFGQETGGQEESKIPDLNSIAERYVRLVLQAGQHDADFVDAYYGDPAWKPQGPPSERVALADLSRGVAALRAELRRIPPPSGADAMQRLRHEYLEKQLQAALGRLAILQGTTLLFDQEAQQLYDTLPPKKTEADFAPALTELEKLLPGSGTLPERYARLRERYLIPKDRVDAVFRAAIEGCRARTVANLGGEHALPAEESFTVEYVTGKSWSAYNWYQGGYRSLIQVNTDLPISIDRALDLACHEGYPGHHVYNVLLEKHLVRARGWVEFSVYPLFSPQSLIAEGTANFGIEVAFPGETRLAFERDTLYPLAGLDPKSAALYSQVQRILDPLSYAGNEAARHYLDGEIDRAAAAQYLERWAMMPADRAEQRTRFFDQYRSYVINYNLGKDLVRTYIEAQGGTEEHPDVRWREFAKLISSPRLPSGLR